MDEKEVVRLKRTQNTLRNIFFGFINKGITLICPFVVRTLLIKIMGLQYAGVDGLFTSILQVLNLSELGLGSAIVYCMYRPIAHGDDKTVCALLKLFRKMYFLIGMVVLLIGMGLMPFLHFFVKGSYPAEVDIYIIYGIYLVNSCGSYFFMGYRGAILSAYQRQDVIHNICSVVKLVMYVVQALIIIWNHNYYLYAAVFLLCTVLINLITAYESRRLFPQYVCKGTISTDIKKDLKEKVSGLMITKLCAITRNSFDSIFISAFIGLTVAALYTNYYFIMQSLINIFGIIIQAILAGIGNSIQTESVEQNYEDLKRFNFMYLWLAGVGTTCLLCLYQPFMCLWMGSDNLLPASTVVLFCIYFYLLKMGDIQSAYYTAAGLWWYYRKYTIAEAALNLLLNYLLVKIWGINGVIAGTLLSLFLVNFLCCERLVFKLYFKNGKTLEFYLRQIRYAITTVIACVVTYFICRYIQSVINLNSLMLKIIIRLIICIVISNIIYFIAYRKTLEYKSAYVWVKQKKASFHRCTKAK